jgi:hypothetical protein
MGVCGFGCWGYPSYLHPHAPPVSLCRRPRGGSPSYGRRRRSCCSSRRWPTRPLQSLWRGQIWRRQGFSNSLAGCRPCLHRHILSRRTITADPNAPLLAKESLWPCTPSWLTLNALAQTRSASPPAKTLTSCRSLSTSHPALASLSPKYLSSLFPTASSFLHVKPSWSTSPEPTHSCRHPERTVLTNSIL